MKIGLLFAALMLFGCELSENHVKSSEQNGLSTPDVVRMVGKFKSQASQIELNGCQFLYNEKPLFWG